MEKFQGVIFDMDGLLVDTELLYYEATQRTADVMGFPYSQEYYLRYLGLSDEELHEKYYQDFAQFTKEEVAAFIESAYKEIFRTFHEDSVPLKSGAKAFLQTLAKQKIPMVIASSNTKEVVEILIEKTGIQPFFLGYVTADDVLKAKPHPEIVEKAVALLGISPETTLMLEDSINGIRAAYTANVPVAMVPDLLPPTEEALEKTIGVYPSLEDVYKQLF